MCLVIEGRAWNERAYGTDFNKIQWFGRIIAENSVEVPIIN